RFPRKAQAELQEPLNAVYLLLAAHVLSMLGFSTYAALLPELRDEWRMSNSEAGIVSGMFFAGYIATVSLWTALTDRIDARKVYFAGSLFAAAAAAGFGFLAKGFASAVLFQMLLGVGIACSPIARVPAIRSAIWRIAWSSSARAPGWWRSSCTRRAFTTAARFPGRRRRLRR